MYILYEFIIWVKCAHEMIRKDFFYPELHAVMLIGGKLYSYIAIIIAIYIYIVTELLAIAICVLHGQSIHILTVCACRERSVSPGTPYGYIVTIVVYLMGCVVVHLRVQGVNREYTPFLTVIACM